MIKSKFAWGESMNEEQKQSVNLILSLLKTTLKECNLYMGVVIDKTDFNKSQIAFIDKSEYAKGNTSGLMVTLDELNK